MPVMDGLFRFSLLLLFVPILLGAILGCGLTWAGLRRRMAMRFWLPVEVAILSGRVEEQEHRGWYFIKTRTWDFVIDYEYTHQGQTHQAEARLQADVPGGPEPDPQVLDNAVAQARQRLLDRLADLRVNPEDPSQTAWTTEPAGRATLRLTLFGLTALASLAVLISLFSS